MNRCLSCAEELNAATAMDGGASPAPGNITLCFYCGHIMAFADDLGFRELTAAEAYKVAGDRKILAAQRARLAVLKERE